VLKSNGEGLSSNFASPLACNTTYHAGYSENHLHGVRTYDAGIPAVLHVSQHVFIDRELVQNWNALQRLGWCVFAAVWQLRSVDLTCCVHRLSFSNIAETYNEAGARRRAGCAPWPVNWPHQQALDGPTVSTSFFLHALCIDHDSLGTLLRVPSTGPHGSRFKGALRARNERMILEGQKFWRHACAVCSREVDGEEEEDEEDKGSGGEDVGMAIEEEARQGACLYSSPLLRALTAFSAERCTPPPLPSPSAIRSPFPPSHSPWKAGCRRIVRAAVTDGVSVSRYRCSKRGTPCLLPLPTTTSLLRHPSESRI
jgi:hypothetical protein